MSYIRAGHPLEFVHGMSEDYVYCSGQEIVDYGSISNAGLIEILCQHWNAVEGCDELLKWRVIQYLAQRLHVPLKEEFKKKGGEE